jgi:hypothetical protein
MPFIQGKVAVEEIDKDMWLLLEPVIYAGRKERFEVPTGFTTDFATVPQVFTWLVPRYGVYTKAAILHDYLCVEKPVNRSDADGIFRRVMRELGVSFLRRWIMWAAVRAGSGLSHASPSEFLIWLFVAIPAVAFLLIPTLVVIIFSAVFWLIEAIVYLFLKPFSKKQVNGPDGFGIAPDN